MAMFRPDCPLSFAHLAAIEVPPAELVGLLAASGFASTSLRLMTPGGGLPEYPLRDAAERRRTRERLAATGVELLYVEIIALTRDLDVAALAPMLEAGAELGARRVLVSGDDADASVVAAKLAETAALARRFGLGLDLEFMPFRAVRTFAEGLAVVEASGDADVGLCVDALHFYRSGSRLGDLEAAAPGRIGAFQICDAPAVSPADLAFEARNARLLPGLGGLGLRRLMAALPDGVPIAVEVPITLATPGLGALERMRKMADATRGFLAGLAA